MTKLLFLDIDGVLNHQLWYSSVEDKKQNTHEEWENSQFCPWSVGLLNKLTDETKSKIVVSSSWRQGKTVQELQDLFEKVGITSEVIDKTPKLYFNGIEDYTYSVPRGCEIKAWMELNKDKLGSGIGKYDKYVIFDDDSDMLYWQRNNFLWVDPYCGLTPALIFKAKQILR